MTTHNPDQVLYSGGKAALLDRDGYLHYGQPAEILDERVLSDLYREPVRVFYSREMGRKVCLSGEWKDGKEIKNEHDGRKEDMENEAMEKMEDYTPVKKMMTERMVRLYCEDHHDGEPLCGECRKDLDRMFAHLDACKFKDKGWPCPTCPECCFRGDDLETMTRVMAYVQEWMEKNPDKAASMMPPAK